MIAVSDLHKEACLAAWIQCENVITRADVQKEKKGLIPLLNECADICLGMLQAISTRSVNVNRLALLCVGICHECADVCERFQCRSCAIACRRCAEALSSLARNAIS